MFHSWAPYVPVARRRLQAAQEMRKMAKAGAVVTPVVISGRVIATTAWGRAWCDNLEGYSDYANRLPRGRTYVRNGSVVDLQIGPGTAEAWVSGSTLYRTIITVKPVETGLWRRLCAECAGGIDSLVELLRGRFDKGVMQRLCRRGEGLFPMPKELRFSCSCPDSASMCKHVAAVLYGVGSRFDANPDLLFTLRQIDPADLLGRAGSGLSTSQSSGPQLIGDIGAIFGLEMEGTAADATSLARVPHQPEPPTPRSSRAPATALAPKDDPAARLLDALLADRSLDNTAARAATGLAAHEVRGLLKRLVEDGHARVVGQKRGTRYVAVTRKKRG